ncbi:MAG: hypothetical protein V4695_11600 [Pseudomonadota bacterium]
MKTANFPCLLLVIYRGIGIFFLLILSALAGTLAAALLHIFTDFFNSKQASQSLAILFQLTSFYAQFSIPAAVLIGPLVIGCVKLMKLPLSIIVSICCGVVVAGVPFCLLVALTFIAPDGGVSEHLLFETGFVGVIALIGGASGGGFFGIVWKLKPNRGQISLQH